MLFLDTTGYGYSKRLCEDVVCWFVSKYLPRYKLEIEVLHRGLKKDGVVGYCDIAGETYKPREFLIELDTHMDKKTYVRVLLHELYHLQQWVKGELKLKASKKYFKGECMDDLQYWQQSHEIFAYWNDKILYQEYLNDRHLTHL
jgi:hypothetical protein